MKVIVSTSNAYKHIIPAFAYLYARHWGDEATLIGYEHPGCELPDCIEFRSMGVQRIKSDFTTDLSAYFKTLSDPFVWICEDTFIKSIDRYWYNHCIELSRDEGVGRVSLTNNSYQHYYPCQYKDFFVKNAYMTTMSSDYRLSMQPAIWRPEYVLKHMQKPMSPWEFENQCGTLMTFEEDQYINIALGKEQAPLLSNEGIRRHDLNRFDFTGMSEEDLQHLQTLGYKHDPWKR